MKKKSTILEKNGMQIESPLDTLVECLSESDS